MSGFVRVLRVIGRALRRAVFAVGRFFQFAGKRISRGSKTSKLNKRIAKKEKAIEQLYSEIGRNYYEAHSEAPEELLSALVEEVSGNKNAIDEAKAKIEELRGAYTEAKAQAKEKAKARREADRAAALAEKESAVATAEAVTEDPTAEEPESPAVFQQPENTPVMEIPVEPEVPAEPEAPVEPETPVEPEAPVEPEVPAEPEIPAENEESAAD